MQYATQTPANDNAYNNNSKFLKVVYKVQKQI